MLEKFYVFALLSVFFLTACMDDMEVTMTDDGTTTVIVERDKLQQFHINTNGEIIVDEQKINATLVILKEGKIAIEELLELKFVGHLQQQFREKPFGLEAVDNLRSCYKVFENPFTAYDTALIFAYISAIYI